MSLIKPRTRGKVLRRHVSHFDRETSETLFAYAQFLGESTEYVLTQLIDTVLARDKEFLRWRAEHPDSCVPPPRRTVVAQSRRTPRPRSALDRPIDAAS